jgi:hypothetical protein
MMNGEREREREGFLDTEHKGVNEGILSLSP